MTSLSPIHLSIVDSSYVYAIPPCVRFGLFQVVDLCCGLGGFSCLLGRVGMRLKFGVDHNAKWEPLFACFISLMLVSCMVISMIRPLFEPWLKEVASMVFCVQESAAMLIPSWVISLA